MYKFNIFLIVVAAVLIGIAGCSKDSASEKIIGKWKAETPSNEQLTDSMKVELKYEFTKDKMIASGSIHGQDLPKMEIPYTVKSEGDTLVLEATHPQSGQKGDFKIVFKGDKMDLIDPDGVPIVLVKE
jgi:hypothetical protein